MYNTYNVKACEAKHNTYITDNNKEFTKTKTNNIQAIPGE